MARWLERNGSRAAAVPAFIPIDMSPAKRGMQGAVDWRGNYDYCFACQAACPVGTAVSGPTPRGGSAP